MFRRRRPEREIAFSFDSFLDVVANVVGIILRLILVAWVGARSYKAVVPDFPTASTSVQGELTPLPDPTDPRLARIERLRRLLDAEGLFDPRLKRPIPFLPATVGLITGRASAAERDVTTVAAARWPAVQFAVRNTAVQGPTAVAQIVEALRELDADPDVEVIVVARGGGGGPDRG